MLLSFRENTHRKNYTNTKTMRLKIRSPNGDCTLPANLVQETSTLETLLFIIESKSGIPYANIKSLQLGFPKRHITPSVRHLNCDLKALGIKNGDILTVSTEGSLSAASSSESLSKTVTVDSRSKLSRKRSSADLEEAPQVLNWPGLGSESQRNQNRIPKKKYPNPGIPTYKIKP